ncbi:hypothetical protein [Leyella stercorea]|uniref:hypothetical protein n=1 Tax=Leyella stercorea TaxID=363265 RepID=UPI00242B38D6|nr:hypothetical protein [Leyella stercorea]
MTRIIRTLLIVIMMVASNVVAIAQQPNRQQQVSREQLAEIEAKHIAHELAFSDAVSGKFVATYCNYKKDIWALGPRLRPNRRGGASEQDNEKRIKQRFARSEKILNIRQKYYKEYSKFLTQAQIEKVYEQERMLMKRHAKRGKKMATPK